MRIIPAALAALLLAAGLVAGGPLAAKSALAQAPPVSPTNQAVKVRAVTPSDTVNLPGGITLGIFIGDATACNIAMILQNDTAAVTWLNVQSGAVLPARAKRVMAANTSCAAILALY